MSFENISNHFKDYFPNYAKDIPDDIFPNLFQHRLNRIFSASPTTAKLFLEAKQNGEMPVNIEVIPLVLAHVRLMAYQRLWDETPDKTLQRVVDTADGEERVYKYNTKDRLAILVEFRRELESLGILQQKKKPTDDFEDDEMIELISNEDSDLWNEVAEDAD